MRSFTHGASALSVALLFVLLFAAPAGAQVPPIGAAPDYFVEVVGAPAEFTGLNAANATSSVSFQVVLTLARVICTAPVTIPVEVTASATGAPSNLALLLEPSIVNITISEGPHGSPPVGEPGGGTGDVTLRATIAGNITANATAQVTLGATAPPPTGCQGAGQIGTATSTPVIVFANLTAPPPPPAPTPANEDTPGLGLVAVVAVAAALAFGRRRRE